MAVAVRVEVLLFARLRELAGQRSVQVEVPVGGTARAAWEAAVDHAPSLAGADSQIRVAVNEGYASWDAPLHDGDTVAFLPPVAGGSAERLNVLVTRAPLDARRCEELVRSDADGAVCTFTGVVRDHAEGRAVTAIEYEAYEEMAEAELRRIGEEVLAATGATAVALHHRIGELSVGEASVVVSASAAHRAESFDACRRAIDTLKARAPIWKREWGEGGAVWVDEAARSSRAR
jgi:molybdopterin converting factor subunit 1